MITLATCTGLAAGRERLDNKSYGDTPRMAKIKGPRSLNALGMDFCTASCAHRRTEFWTYFENFSWKCFSGEDRADLIYARRMSVTCTAKIDNMYPFPVRWICRKSAYWCRLHIPQRASLASRFNRLSCRRVVNHLRIHFSHLRYICIVTQKMEYYRWSPFPLIYEQNCNFVTSANAEL